MIFNTSILSCLSHNTSWVVSLNALNSALAVDNATTFCFLDNQDTTLLKLIIYPLIAFWPSYVILSASMYASNLIVELFVLSFSYLYLI